MPTRWPPPSDDDDDGTESERSDEILEVGDEDDEVTGDELRSALAAAGLLGFALALEEAGWDDLSYLRSLSQAVLLHEMTDEGVGMTREQALRLHASCDSEMRAIDARELTGNVVALPAGSAWEPQVVASYSHSRA